MNDYKKFMTPFWQEFETKIIEYFKSNDISSFKECKEITHAMILDGGYISAIYCQSHHMWNYWHHTKKRIENMKSFIEFGGGYGALCKVIREVNQSSYTIIDIPIINKIQQYFLNNISNVNYIGIDTLENHNTLSCDMFISLYALSESSSIAIEYVLEKKFFNANNILMCFRKEDNEEFKATKYIPEFKKFGDVIEMDDEGLYLIK